MTGVQERSDSRPDHHPVSQAGRRSRSTLTPFQRLARPHALMVAGEAVMAISLANSLFFSIRPGEARGKVLLFLALSMAPFAVIAPLIGPAIDRMPGGRRLVVQIVALGRCLVALLMVLYLDSLLLFPLAFAALVLSKTYTVSKSALVPTVVSSETELVEANSKLGIISGVAGFVAAVPAALLQLISPKATLVLDALDLRRRVPHGEGAAARDRGGDSPGLPGAGGAALRGDRARRLGDGIDAGFDRVPVLPPRLLAA